MPELAVTVVGQDRPGIIASTAAKLSELGMNLEDSSMTRLRGHFAMTLICVGDAEASQVEEALAALRDDALEVTVRTLSSEPDPGLLAGPPQSWLVSVHGADRLGIVAEIAGVLARRGGNITDLTTRLVGSLYVLTAEVDLAADADAEAVADELLRTGRELGVEVSVEPLADDEL